MELDNTFQSVLLVILSVAFGGLFTLFLYKLGYLNVQYFSALILFITGFIIGILISEHQFR